VLRGGDFVIRSILRAGIWLIPTLMCFTSTSLSALDLPVLRHTRSSLLTPGTPDVAIAEQTQPNVVATSRGYCVTWLDRRQGGMIMAARIASDGSLLDPLGIPISPVPQVYPGTVDIISDQEKGVVLLRSATGVDGYAIDLTGIPNPRLAFQLDAAGGSAEIAATEDEIAVVAVTSVDGVTVTLVDTDGLVHWSHMIKATHFGLRAALTGETAWVFLRPATASGDLGMWKFDDSGVTAFETGIDAQEVFRWGVVAADDDLVIVDADPRAPENISFYRLNHEGGLQQTMTVPTQDVGWLEQLWAEGKVVKALMSGQPGMTIAEFRETGDISLTGVPDVRDAAIEPGDPDFSVWLQNEAKIRYGFGLPGSTGGTPISSALTPELVADAAVVQDGIAVIWVEARGDLQSQVLRLGLVDPETLTLRSSQVVGEGTIIGAPPQESDVIPRAAIDRTGETLVVAWIDGASLKMRRATLGGEWLGDATKLSDSAETLHPDGLVPFRDGLVLLWTEHRAQGLKSNLRAVSIDEDGSVEPRDPSGFANVAWPAASEVDDGLLVVVRNVEYTGCTVLCDFYDFQFLLLNPDGAWMRPSLSNLYAITYGRPTIATASNQVLLLNETLGTSILSLSGAGLSAETEFRESADAIGGLFWSGRFHVLSRERNDSAPQSATRLSRLRPEEEVNETEVRIADVGATPRFIPKLVELNGRLYILSSEVSLDPKEGSVRRLRIHEIVPEVVRRRGVRH